jgi:ATP-dependent RNA helicase RhlE
VSLDQLNLSKQWQNAMSDAGFTQAREAQAKCLSRINGGHDLIVSGPEGIGKTTTLVLGVLMRLKYAQEEAPRALILVPDKEKGQALEETFALLGKYSNVRVLGIYPGPGIEGQKDDLAEGTDVVIGTPDRIQTIYYKSGINLNKLRMFIIDDAELIIKNGFQTAVLQLSESKPKSQNLVFTQVLSAKLDRLTESFMNFPTTVEVDEEFETQLDIIPQQVYKVPNFKTKLNLLPLLLQNTHDFSKVIVFVNTRITAENVFKHLVKSFKGEVGLYKSFNEDSYDICEVEAFLESNSLRVLVIDNERAGNEEININAFLVMIHFDFPLELDDFIAKVYKEEEGETGQSSLIFATDIELIEVSKAEQATGNKFQVMDLPEGLSIEETPLGEQRKLAEKEDPTKGGAFHEKKASNVKDYNFTYHDRLKRFGKKHRKHKKGEK